MWNQRTHPELTWQTLETDHFKIHFHQGIEEIARKGAAIAEQSYQPIMDQLQLTDFGKTDIVLSAEDEIMNGFAMPSDQIFIWVSQNDVAGHFGGSDKWLKMVITHEFQHVAQFQAHRTWAGVIAGISIPSWWYEGMAEYMTEVWRVGRSDARMKIHTYKNTMNQLDAHDDGYAKVLYLASKYGDSTLVNISRHRVYLDKDNQKFPYWYSFDQAFREETGQTLANFNEEWRRVMNTYYYGYKAQKESIEELGETFTIPGFARVRAARLAPDSGQVAVIGRASNKMRDFGLYVFATDSSQQREELHFGRFSGSPTWSPDGSQIMVSEYHRGKHGSLIYDLRLINVENKKKSWLTQNMRTHHPVFSSDGRGIFFVAHPGETSDIYYQEISSGHSINLTKFSGDIQVRDLDLDDAGQRLAFSIQEANGDVNIAMLNVDGSSFTKLTHDPEEDLYPVWTQDGKAVIFTSYRNGTPNLYRVNLDSSEIIQMTDVAEGVFSRQRIPGSEHIMAATLADVDTVRILRISPDRIAPDLTLNMRENYAAWRNKRPDILIPAINMNPPLITESAAPYKAYQNMRPLARMIFPDTEGLFGMAVYNDALGKHLIQAATVLGWDGTLAGGYLSYLNLIFKPAIHIYASKDLAFNLRRSFDRRFFEMRNGAGLALQLPMNTGNSLSSNHSIRFEIEALERDLTFWPSIENGNVGSVSSESISSELNTGLTYMWKSQRPHAQQYILPHDGVGFLAHVESTLPDIYGENDYTQTWLEGFLNYEIPKLPLVFYARLKWVKQSGTLPLQDQLGFSETSPLYFANSYWNTLKGIGLFDAPESYSLRGQTGHYPALELVYSVSELRMPLLPEFPVNLFGLGVQNMTMAAFYDFGYLPEAELDLSTYGAEIKFDVSLGKLALFTMALGLGGDDVYWSDGELEPYLQMALVNPF